MVLHGVQVRRDVLVRYLFGEVVAEESSHPFQARRLPCLPLGLTGRAAETNKGARQVERRKSGLKVTKANKRGGPRDG